MDRTTWSYDLATGLLTNKVYADGKGPAYTYTSDGKLATRTWARGVVTTYSYDPFGQLSSVSYSDNTPGTTFSYDRLGRQTTITDGAGTRAFTYNDSLQLASEQSQISNQQFEITHQYDAYGRSAGFDAGTNYSVRYAYDEVGRFSSLSNNVGGALRAATYSYLPGSDLLAGLSNGPIAVTRSYEDTRNLITQVKNTSGSTTISQYAYVNDAVGRRTSVGMTGDAFSDLGVSHNKYAYNERSELEQAKRYGGTNLASTANAIDGQAFLYGYDLIGNRTETYIGDMLNGSKHTYTANSLNQYTQQTVPAKARIMGAAATDANVTVNNQSTTRNNLYFYSCLDIANSSSAAYPLINVVGVKKNSGSNGLDVVTSATGHVFVAQSPEQFSYDDDGNLTQDGRWTYTWDAENRLIGMQTLSTLPSSVPRMKLAFAYDYMSRRIGKVVYTNDSGSWILNSGFSFAYDGWNLIQEHLTSDTSHLTNSYVWGLDLSGTLRGAGGIGGLLSSCSFASNASHFAFYLFDANGNVGQLISTNDSILARYEYDPYGKLIKDVADVSVRNNPFRFSSKYLDSETGMYYYGYRYYSAESGRWVNRDPLEEQGGMNIYEFVLNNPIALFDAFGLLHMDGSAIGTVGPFQEASEVGHCGTLKIKAAVDADWVADHNVPPDGADNPEHIGMWINMTWDEAYNGACCCKKVKWDQTAASIGPDGSGSSNPRSCNVSTADYPGTYWANFGLSHLWQSVTEGNSFETTFVSENTSGTSAVEVVVRWGYRATRPSRSSTTWTVSYTINAWVR